MLRERNGLCCPLLCACCCSLLPAYCTAAALSDSFHMWTPLSSHCSVQSMVRPLRLIAAVRGKHTNCHRSCSAQLPSHSFLLSLLHSSSAISALLDRASRSRLTLAHLPSLPVCAMSAHFSVNKQSSTIGRSWQSLTSLDWLHFFGRFLVCLYFLYSLLWTLSHIEEAAEKVSAAGLPPDTALPAVFASIALSFIGSALFFTACDPHSFYLLMLLLLPQTVVQHVLPLPHLHWDSAAFHTHTVSALQSLALLGAVLVIYTYTLHVAWLEGEQKAEIRRAMEAWYAAREQEAAVGGKGAAEVEHKREPKKAK